MNRQQRRHPKRVPGVFGGHAPQREVVVSTDYMHTDTHVVLKFSQKLDFLQMTPEQCDKTIEHIEGTKSALLAHQAKKARERSDG